MLIFMYFTDQEILLNLSIHNTLFLVIQHAKYLKTFKNFNPIDSQIPKHCIFIQQNIIPTYCICIFISLQKEAHLCIPPHLFLSKLKLMLLHISTNHVSLHISTICVNFFVDKKLSLKVA